MPRAGCKYRVLVAVGAIVILVSSTSSTAQARARRAQPTLTIGHLATESSVFSGRSTESRDVLDAWVKWRNAHGGINGHPVKMTAKDDHGDAETAQAAVKELVESDKVLAIVGENAARNDYAWQQYTKDQRTPIIGGNPYSLWWLANPMWYPASTTIFSMLYGQVYAAKQAGASSIGLLWCSDDPQCQQAVAVFRSNAKAVGLDFVFEQGAPATAANYTAECVAAKKSGAESFFVQGTVPMGLTVIRDCARQNYDPKWVTSQGTLGTNAFKVRGFRGAVGDMSNFPFFKRYPQNKRFFEALERYHPDYLNGKKVLTQISSITWSSAEVFARAMQIATRSNDNPGRQDLIKALATFKDETLGGLVPPLTYGDGTTANPQVKCFWYVELVAKPKPHFVSPDGMKTVCQPN